MIITVSLRAIAKQSPIKWESPSERFIRLNGDCFVPHRKAARSSQ